MTMNFLIKNDGFCIDNDESVPTPFSPLILAPFVLAHFLWNVGAQAGEDRVFLVDLAADMVTQIAPEDVDNDTWR